MAKINLYFPLWQIYQIILLVIILIMRTQEISIVLSNCPEWEIEIVGGEEIGMMNIS